MIKAIMATDDKGGVSKGKSMPWQKNSNDLQWFKKNTLNQVVVMGRLTWEDPFMPTPLKSRINVLVTRKNPSLYPGVDHYLQGDLNATRLMLSEIQNETIFKELAHIFLAEIPNNRFGRSPIGRCLEGMLSDLWRQLNRHNIREPLQHNR
mgnify:CR=1 FL=1